MTRLRTQVHAHGWLVALLLAGGSCGGNDVALDCSKVAMRCDSGRYRVDGAGCILECLSRPARETPPICPAGPPMTCPFGIELDPQGCIRGCMEPRPVVAGLCIPDGEPVPCSGPAGQPARECMSDALVCSPDMRCVPKMKVLCDPRGPTCPPGLVCRLPDGCRPPVERCLGGYITDPLGCVRGCRPPPMPPAPGCTEPPPPCAGNLYQLDEYACIAGCRPPPMTMPPPSCPNLGERCATADIPVCRGCAFGYTLDPKQCLGTMCQPDPGAHPCPPPPDRCESGFAADPFGCLTCRK